MLFESTVHVVTVLAKMPTRYHLIILPIITVEIADILGIGYIQYVEFRYCPNTCRQHCSIPKLWLLSMQFFVEVCCLKCSVLKNRIGHVGEGTV